MELFNKKNLKP